MLKYNLHTVNVQISFVPFNQTWKMLINTQNTPNVSLCSFPVHLHITWRKQWSCFCYQCLNLCILAFMYMELCGIFFLCVRDFILSAYYFWDSCTLLLVATFGSLGVFHHMAMSPLTYPFPCQRLAMWFLAVAIMKKLLWTVLYKVFLWMCIFISLELMTKSSVQFISVAQSCPALCDPMDCSTPGLPVHHQLPEFTQTHVHWVSDAIQPSHPLLSPSPPTFNLSQHQGLLKWVTSSH